MSSVIEKPSSDEQTHNTPEEKPGEDPLQIFINRLEQDQTTDPVQYPARHLRIVPTEALENDVEKTAQELENTGQDILSTDADIDTKQKKSGYIKEQLGTSKEVEQKLHTVREQFGLEEESEEVIQRRNEERGQKTEEAQTLDEDVRSKKELLEEKRSLLEALNQKRQETRDSLITRYKTLIEYQNKSIEGIDADIAKLQQSESGYGQIIENLQTERTALEDYLNVDTLLESDKLAIRDTIDQIDRKITQSEESRDNLANERARLEGRKKELEEEKKPWESNIAEPSPTEQEHTEEDAQDDTPPQEPLPDSSQDDKVPDPTPSEDDPTTDNDAQPQEPSEDTPQPSDENMDTSPTPPDAAQKDTTWAEHMDPKELAQEKILRANDRIEQVTQNLHTLKERREELVKINENLAEIAFSTKESLKDTNLSDEYKNILEHTMKRQAQENDAIEKTMALLDGQIESLENELKELEQYKKRQEKLLQEDTSEDGDSMRADAESIVEELESSEEGQRLLEEFKGPLRTTLAKIKDAFAEELDQLFESKGPIGNYERYKKAGEKEKDGFITRILLFIIDALFQEQRK